MYLYLLVCAFESCEVARGENRCRKLPSFTFPNLNRQILFSVFEKKMVFYLFFFVLGNILQFLSKTQKKTAR